MAEYSITGTVTLNINAENEQDAIEKFIEKVSEEASYGPGIFGDINIGRLDYEDDD